MWSSGTHVIIAWLAARTYMSPRLRVESKVVGYLKTKPMRPILLSTLLMTPLFAQLSPQAEWATHAANEYQVIPNVTYLTAGGHEVKLDVYQRRGMTTPQPTVMFFHGGFWVAGNKEAALPALLPWMEMGWNVVNVEYRLGRVAPAPAALEDC